MPSHLKYGGCEVPSELIASIKYKETTTESTPSAHLLLKGRQATLAELVQNTQKTYALNKNGKTLIRPEAEMYYPISSSQSGTPSHKEALVCKQLCSSTFYYIRHGTVKRPLQATNDRLCKILSENLRKHL